MITKSIENGQYVRKCEFDGNNHQEVMQFSGCDCEWSPYKRCVMIHYNNGMIELNKGDVLVKYPRCRIEKENGK